MATADPLISTAVRHPTQSMAIVNDEGSPSFIRCQRIDALVAMTYYPWAARCPSGIYPTTFGRKEFFWRYLAWMGQGWPQHMRFCSCRSSITEVCLWRIKVLSLWGFTVSVEGLFLCPTLCYLSLYCCNKLNNCLLVTCWIIALRHQKRGILGNLMFYALCQITVFHGLKRTQFFTGTKFTDIIHNYLPNVSLGSQTYRSHLV